MNPLPRLHILETDGSVLPGERHKLSDWPSSGGAGIVLFGPDLKVLLAESVHLGHVSSSAEAEFRAVLVGLRRARDHSVSRLRAWSDSQPVLTHISGGREIAAPWAHTLAAEVRALVGQFEHIEFRWTRSSHARERRAGVPTADALARRALSLGPRRR